MTPGLAGRIAFTLGALFVYRLGHYIPLPGISAEAWQQYFQPQLAHWFFNPGSGNTVTRLAVFSFGIMPYLAAAIVVQIGSFVVPRLKRLRIGDAHAREQLTRATLYLTILFVAAQAYGYAEGLEAIRGLVATPGWLFRLTTVVTLIGGTMFLIWLSRLITAHGVGNGLAVLLLANIVVEFPAGAAGMIEFVRQGVVPANLAASIAILIVVVTAAVVLVERAQRRLAVVSLAYQPGAIQGRAMLPIRVNSAGLIPVLIASWMMALPIGIAGINAQHGSQWWYGVAQNLEHGRPLFIVIYGVLIVVFAFIYAAMIVDPDEQSAALQKYGMRIDGVEPGEPTAAHLDGALSYTAITGALYLAAICLIPEILIGYTGLPFYFVGPSLLVLVCTTLDIEAQVKGERMLRRGG